MASGTIRVRGLRELDRALNAYDKDLKKEVRKELKVVAEPVRSLSEQMAVGNISNVGATWSRMKLGVKARAVYVAPRARPTGQGTARPNLARMLKAQMEASLEQKTPDVVKGFEDMIDRLTSKHGF